MGQAIPIKLELPDGSQFQSTAPIRSNVRYSANYALMAWLNPPNRSLANILEKLIEERDEHEGIYRPWLERLERAVKSERFNNFWVYEPTARSCGLPEDSSRAEIGAAYRKKHDHSTRHSKYLYGLHEDLKRETGCARIGDLRHHYGWTHAFLKEQFELHVKWTRNSMLFCRRNLANRRKMAQRSSAWFEKNHNRWIAIEAHPSFINPTPEEALAMLPSFNHRINGNDFYTNPTDAFLWLGTINIDNPAISDWQITPTTEAAKKSKARTYAPNDRIEDQQITGTGKFLYTVVIDDVNLENPSETLSKALKASGLRFAIRRFQQLESV